MTGYILDCCTLLNLYCGWGGLQNLKAMNGAFHVGATVASEALYVRDYDDGGEVVRRKLAPTELYRQCRLATLKLSTLQEVALMVQLASSMDDGEAEGLAMAVCRGHAFCTDDGAVHKLVAAKGIKVRLVSTPEIFQLWAGDDPTRLASLAGTVRRTSELGKFRPYRSSSHEGWWSALLTG